MNRKGIQKYILGNFNQAELIPIEWTNLLSHCLLDLFTHDVDVLLEKLEHLSSYEYSEAVDGDFEGHDPTHIILRVATGSKPEHWFRAFVHEYAHFCQSKSVKVYESGSLEDEFDCEKRAIETMRSFDISIKSSIKLIYIFFGLRIAKITLNQLTYIFQNQLKNKLKRHSMRIIELSLKPF
jgi:hypothetical protein